ncbi:MAG: hypothetical protein BM564_09040 [Bacteroidetes bacterium MedPE-SWsnd-G2]|nr:MAG: hypothetical protein BM564_09040 [Bacteroidetes bacterium MedPE-SWsnd-G2]
MKPRDLFRVILKLIGLLLLFNGVVPAFINLVEWLNTDLTSVIFLVLTIIIVLCVIYALIFKTDWVLNTLKLDKGFDSETFNFTSNKTSLFIEIGAGVVGLFFVLKNLPQVLIELYFYFRFNASTLNHAEQYISDEYALYLSILYIFVGTLTIAFRKWIAKLFN